VGVAIIVLHDIHQDFLQRIKGDLEWKKHGLRCQYDPPKTSSSPLKNDGWKTNFPFEMVLVDGTYYIMFREVNDSYF